MDHATFVAKYPPQPPAKPVENSDEARHLGSGDGVRLLDQPPALVPAPERAVPKRKGDPGCHLWVFTRSERPYILELARVVPALQSGRVKHSNLTSDGQASCGGELWVDPVRQDRLYVNGCSGRYGPTSPQQLEDAVSVLRDAGFDVICFGWDDDAGKPAMVLRS
ncbi:MAG: hypothetical protein AB1730_22095 [Myxococcota bacterium]